MRETLVAQFLLKALLVPVLLLWGYHLAQRRFADTVGVKRMATLFVTVLILAAWLAVYAFIRFVIRDIFLVALAAAVIAVAVWQRRRLFPYRLRCAQCSRPLGLRRILFHGNNLCAACDPAAPDTEDTP